VKTLRALLLGAALVVAASACGGDGDDAADTTTTEEQTTTTLSEAENQAAIEAVMTDFFRLLGEQSTDDAVPLLENGEAHRAEIEACKEVTKGATVAVKSVEIVDPANANVVFDILINGAVVLPDGGGAVVYTDGQWLVAEDTFQSLYDLAKDSCTPTDADSTTTTTAG
jgi:hypothetical protein